MTEKNDWPSFWMWLSDRLNTSRWVVAWRLTPHLATKFDTAVSPKEFEDLRREYDAMKRVRA